MLELLDSVLATWHHTRAWEKSLEQGTFCYWNLFQLKWQSRKISRAVQLDVAAEITCDPCDWSIRQIPAALSEGQPPHLMQCLAGTILLQRQCNSSGITFSPSASMKYITGCFYIERRVLSHLAFYLISPLISTWRLLLHRCLYSRSRRSLKAKTLLCPRLNHRDESNQSKSPM